MNVFTTLCIFSVMLSCALTAAATATLKVEEENFEEQTINKAETDKGRRDFVVSANENVKEDDAFTEERGVRCVILKFIRHKICTRVPDKPETDKGRRDFVVSANENVKEDDVVTEERRELAYV